MLKEIKIWKFEKNGHILRNEIKIIKDLINAFLNSHCIYKGYRSI
jgi:hypothetical protein